MTEFNIEDRFHSCCYRLETEDIQALDREDNGPVNNVMAGIADHCYGTKLSEYEHGLLAEMFYINVKRERKGDIIALNVRDPHYYELLLRFCVMLADHYQEVDALAAFNTFQTKLRGFLEKYGFFTVTSQELKPFRGKSAVMMSSASRGIIKVDFIEHREFYRDFFNNIVDRPIVKDREYVYLMVNSDTFFIKIGRSTKPFYRERTLHSQEPGIHTIALWPGDGKLEKELHAVFKHRNVRGEWFRLTLADLIEVEKLMAARSAG